MAVAVTRTVALSKPLTLVTYAVFLCAPFSSFFFLLPFLACVNNPVGYWPNRLPTWRCYCFMALSISCTVAVRKPSTLSAPTLFLLACDNGHVSGATRHGRLRTRPSCSSTWTCVCSYSSTARQKTACISTATWLSSRRQDRWRCAIFYVQPMRTLYSTE